MKNLYSGAMHCNRKSFTLHRWLHGGLYNTRLYFCLLGFIGTLFIACKKESGSVPAEYLQNVNSHSDNAEGDVVSSYTGLSWQTTWELQQARAATAKYRNVENAIKDGYADIAVDVENMGHHFMKTSIVDGTFDIRQPEILVYNKDHDGNQVLVAAEYAIPLTNPQPAGFTGSADVWDGNAGFQLWLLHAWVWAYNPSGVFNPTNPTVHLH